MKQCTADILDLNQSDKGSRDYTWATRTISTHPGIINIL